jgi:hypothetical protein
VFGGEQIDFASLLQPEWRAKVTVNNETLLVAQALVTEANPPLIVNMRKTERVPSSSCPSRDAL